ncbi:RNA ligase [Methanocaldococcus fervens]|uniref:ATP dependent DNA ligase n=1 Tax=Methanocaldococcus fervens (strain DSM 4213 / JCM 15782 / AG86) TaxID=573064 RepID=C7P982_METFA|nr:RNA ligase [Methanocaldococcus fervens]ACV25114.1 ATP dependent DNA ligase [Methanocaldococcus fervens AG86]
MQVSAYALDKIAEKLNLSIKDLNKAFKKKILREDEYKEQKYLLFKKGFRGIEKGTVIFLNENLDVVRGYPKTYRAITLYPTIKNHFIDKVVVEEKLNGYNIRIVKVDDEIYALTRSGYICPFTTKKVKKFLNLEILDDYNEYMLCGEMIGLNNPYTPYYYKEADKGYENLGFYIFDIKERETNKSLPVKERMKLCEKYNLPYVKPLAIVDKETAHIQVRKIIEKLNKEGREGVVLKDPDMAVSPIKYTTHYTQCEDLKSAFTFFFDLGIDFIFSRVVREGFMSYEFKESLEERKIRAKDLGEAILLPMVETINKVANGERVSEDFELIFDSEEDFEEFLYFMRKMKMIINIKNVEEINTNEGVKIKALIGKIYNRTNDKIISYLNGTLWE